MWWKKMLRFKCESSSNTENKKKKKKKSKQMIRRWTSVVLQTPRLIIIPFSHTWILQVVSWEFQDVWDYRLRFSVWFQCDSIRVTYARYHKYTPILAGYTAHTLTSAILERDYGFQCVVASTFLQSLSSINSFICLYNFFSLYLISSVQPKITNKLLYINKNWSKHTVFLASK